MHYVYTILHTTILYTTYILQLYYITLVVAIKRATENVFALYTYMVQKCAEHEILWYVVVDVRKMKCTRSFFFCVRVCGFVTECMQLSGCDLGFLFPNNPLPLSRMLSVCLSDFHPFPLSARPPDHLNATAAAVRIYCAAGNKADSINYIKHLRCVQSM